MKKRPTNIVKRFTRYPDIAKSIERELTALLEKAKAGKITGIYIATVEADGDCESTFIGEERMTLYGAAFRGLVKSTARD